MIAPVEAPDEALKAALGAVYDHLLRAAWILEQLGEKDQRATIIEILDSPEFAKLRKG